MKNIQLKSKDISIYPEIEYKKFSLTFEPNFNCSMCKCFQYGDMAYIIADINSSGIALHSWTNICKIPNEIYSNKDIYLMVSPKNLYERCSVKVTNSGYISIIVHNYSSASIETRIAGFWKIG